MLKVILSFLLVLSTASLCFGAVEAGRIVALVGQVKAMSAQKSQRVLHQKSTVYKNDTISTSKGSKARIRFSDGTILSVAPATVIKINEYIYDDSIPEASKFMVNCATGALEFTTGQIVKQNSEGFHFETPLNVIGIRGTHGGVMVSPSGRGKASALLFQSSRPSNMYVKAKSTGAVVVFSGFQQVIHQLGNTVQAPVAISRKLNRIFNDAVGIPLQMRGVLGESGSGSGFGGEVHQSKRSKGHATVGDITVDSDVGDVENIGVGQGVSSETDVHSVDVRSGSKTSDITIEGSVDDVMNVGGGHRVKSGSNVGSVVVGE
ncbi:MAG: FecR family protein [Desulfovibrio sp.]